MNQNRGSYYASSARSPRPCCYCGKVFSTLYAMGGHMTAHRVEMEEARRSHAAATSNNADVVQPGVVAAPQARSSRRCPKTVDFLGLGPHLVNDGDETPADGGDSKFNNGDLDLSLKL